MSRTATTRALHASLASKPSVQPLPARAHLVRPVRHADARQLLSADCMHHTQVYFFLREGGSILLEPQTLHGGRAAGLQRHGQAHVGEWAEGHESGKPAAGMQAAGPPTWSHSPMSIRSRS